jgi:murein endopeptidase
METIKMTLKEKRQIWAQNNKDKLALYARNYYEKRTQVDPDYKTKLCEKEKTNKKNRELKINTEKKPVGRPKKYNIE